MNMENKVGTGRDHQIWSWIFIVIGGLFAFIGILLIWLSLAESKNIYHDQVVIIYLFIGLAIALLVIGIPLIILGIWRLRMRDGKNSRNWGILSTIFGGLYSFLGIAVLVFLIIGSDYDIIGFYIACIVPFLLIGILCLILGIKEISRKGKTTPPYPGELDNT